VTRGTLVAIVLGVTVTLSALGSAGASAVSTKDSTTSAVSTSTVRWLRFHVDLGHSRRADCVDVPAVLPHPMLRCDRYRLHGGASTQQVAVSVYDGAVRRLRPPPDATGDPIGRRLRAGRVWQRGPFACRAMARRIRCHDRNSGRGFVIGRVGVLLATG
jgi:hypothetical protein